MARSRSKAAETVAEAPINEGGDTSFNPAEFDPSYHKQAGEIVHGVAESTRIEPEVPQNGFASKHAPSTSQAAVVGKRETVRIPDPFGVENSIAGENRVQLLKSEGHQAWVIRFAHNPNEDKGPNGETYSKEKPHPVLKMLKEEGYRWGFDSGDGKGGWGKQFEGDPYGADHIEARRVLRQAAEMIGHKIDNGRIPD